MGGNGDHREENGPAKRDKSGKETYLTAGKGLEGEVLQGIS